MEAICLLYRTIKNEKTEHTMPRLLQIRTLLLSLVLACNTTQAAIPAPVSNQRTMTPTQIAQVVTAVLSWPATVARQEYPRAKGFQLIEHCIKVANSGLALINQGDGMINVPWFLYDFVQGTRILGALLTGSELSEAVLEKLVLAAAKAEGQAPAPYTTEAKEQAEQEAASQYNQQIVGTVLATIEASMRLAVALDTARTGSAIQKNMAASYRYILANIGSMARLAHHYLYAATKERQQWLMGLLILNAIATSVSFYQYQKFSPLVSEQQRHLAPLAQQRPLGEGAPPVNAAFDNATFTTGFREFVKDADYLPLSANVLAQHIDEFCTAHAIAPFFDNATDTGRRYQQHFISFAQTRLQQDPNAIRQNARAFAASFGQFTTQQERALAPIRRDHPLPAPDAPPVVNGAFSYEAFIVCCRSFVLQHQSFNNAEDFIVAFTNFCQQQGIANLFDEANPVLRRHRDHLATFWGNHQWWDNPFAAHLPLEYVDHGHETPDQITTRLQHESNNFCNGFRDHCRQAERQAIGQTANP
jgi:hypothetical protein